MRKIIYILLGCIVGLGLLSLGFRDGAHNNSTVTTVAPIYSDPPIYAYDMTSCCPPDTHGQYRMTSPHAFLPPDTSVIVFTKYSAGSDSVISWVKFVPRLKQNPKKAK